MMPVRDDARRFDRLTQDLATLQGLRVAVGVQGGGGDQATIAAVHEYGSPVNNIPERSFLGRTFDTQREQFGRDAGRVASRVVAGEMSPESAADALGLRAASKVRDTIRSNVPPPLQPGTAKRKGTSIVETLRDTGSLINSVGHEVKHV